MRILMRLLGCGAVLTAAGCTSVNSVDDKSLSSAAEPACFAPADSVAASEAKTVAALSPMTAVNSQRKMTYTASLTINTRDVAAAIKQAQAIAVKLGGYAVLIEENSIRLKIPASAMEISLADFAKLGVVSGRTMRAEDVTTQVVNLKIRLDNLEKTRLNLQKLLERSGKVSDLLAVERELARVTTEIECLEAQQKNLTTRVDFFDVTLYFNPVSDPVSVRRVITVPWVAALGSEVGRDSLPMNGKDDKPFEFQMPDGFVASGTAADCDSDSLYALNAENVVLKFTLRKNLNQAPTSFWSRMIRRSLEFRGFGFGDGKVSQTVAADGKASFELLDSGCAYGSEPWSYQVAVAVEPNHWFRDGRVVLVECWGPRAALEKLNLTQLLASVGF